MIKNFFKKMLHICAWLVKTILFLWIFIFLSATVMDFFIAKEFSFQIIIYIIFSIVLLFYSFVFFFLKPNRLLVISYIIAWCVYVVSARTFPDIKTYYDKDVCIDSGVCAEGIKARNNQGILFEINQETCIKYGYKWNDERKDCNLRK